MSAANLPQWKCHKVVRAAKMNRGDYNVLRGWQVPADENAADDGYLVEYIDGGPANHPDYKGYISWSPVAVFEAGYTRLPDGLEGMQPYQQRVVIEQDELGERIDKLVAFLKNAPASLPVDDRVLLQRQLHGMELYYHALRERVVGFRA